jgi:hypothetical protein
VPRTRFAAERGVDRIPSRCHRLGDLLERTHHQPPSQVKLIGIHRHRFGICQGGRRLLDVLFRQQSASDRLFRGDGPVRSGRNTAQDKPTLATATAFAAIWRRLSACVPYLNFRN